MPGHVAADDQGREPRPMMVADDAHVTYRVHASGKRVGPRESLLSLSAARGGRELKAVHALRGVTFTAREGETIGVIGHNGSGKSTLFKAMSGLIPTSEGRIWARDRPVLLGVNAALVPELSGEDNIKLGLLAMGFSKAEAAEHVDEIADFAELNEFIHHPMRTYSSGMGARLRFAIASAKTHSILLIDEALAVGDRKFRTKSEQRIRNLRDSAGLVMIVSHSVSSLRDSCERVLWIHKGELRADGPAGPVIRDYIKWTKDPQSFAVGGTHMVKPTPRPSAERTPGPAGAAAVSVHPSRRGGGSSSSGIEEIFGGLIEPAGVVSSAPATESSRTIARRERYRQTVRARKRRGVVAVVATIATLLVAAAAGAAIALLSSAPEPASTPAASVATDDPTMTAPTIGVFAAAEPTTTCDGDASESTVELSWTVSDAVDIALASATARVDALESPTVRDLPLRSEAQTVAYPCTQASRTYTLTAQGADGTRASASVVVERVSGGSDASEDVETNSPDAPVSGTVPPQSDTVQDSVDSSDPQPAPSAQPSSTSPAPDPQPTEVPAPQPTGEPAPEPTVDPEPVVTPDPLPTIDLPLPGSSEPTG